MTNHRTVLSIHLKAVPVLLCQIQGDDLEKGNALHHALTFEKSGWIALDMFGHQFVTHLNPDLGPDGKVPALYNPVDNHDVPIPHCGVIMQLDDRERFANRLEGRNRRLHYQTLHPLQEAS